MRKYFLDAVLIKQLVLVISLGTSWTFVIRR